MSESLRRVLLTACTVQALGVAPAAIADEAVAPSPSRQRELVALVKQDCGSCHGMRLTGGLGPALTAQALKEKPTESIAATIVAGRAGTAMPPWRPFVTDAEARWLAIRLQQGDIDAH